MVELHVICAANRHIYTDVLEDYFRIRHEIYVGERGWAELARPDGREIDQFDRPDTIYLMALEGSRVVGSHRLVPTTGPTLMSDLFPQLSLRPIIRQADAYELSRVFVVRDYRGSHVEPKVESIIMAGTMEFALTVGLRKFTIVMETWWLPRFMAMGWNPRPLGVPVDINGMSCIGVSIDVTDAAWRETCRQRSVTCSPLAWKGVSKSALGLPQIWQEAI